MALFMRCPSTCGVLLLVGSLALAPGRGAAQVGEPQRALHASVRRFAKAVEEGHVLGAVLLVARGDGILVHEALGHRDVRRERAMRKDTLFRMASNTKAVTAAAVLKLVEAGKVALDDPVSKWFDTFADSRAQRITIRQLLTHSSGLRIPTLFVYPLMKPTAGRPDASRLVLECAKIGKVGPGAEPGETYSYSNPGYNVLAGVVELAAGETFQGYCRRSFYEPMGMRDTCHHERDADPDRMSQVAAWREGGGFRVVWRPGGQPTLPFVRGSGGMITTAAEYLRFARLFLAGGRHGERQILSSALVEAAVADQIPHIEQHRYGFGWKVDAEGFSHTGSDGTFVWCNPQRNLVGMVLTQTQSSPGLSKARQRFRRDVEAAVKPVPKLVR
jgi:CubicO group peptidase (beta-lactamase class C family)